jgi:cell division protein FtsB
MFDFHEKRKIRRVIYSKVSIGFVFIVALVIGVSVYERFVVEREMAVKLGERSEELETLKTRAALLESKVDHLRNERGIEEELRSRFDVVREGEQVVIILDDQHANSKEKTANTDRVQKESASKSFFDFLKFW